MKKLMIALAAVATAFGLRADVMGGAGFDSADAAPMTWVGGVFDTDYWSGTEGVTTLNTNPGDSGLATDKRPAGFNIDRDGYMEIATQFGNPVVQNIKSKGQAQFIETGFYYDSLVNLTICDEDPTFDNAAYEGAKIYVYAKYNNADDETQGTNYYVAAANAAGGVTAYKTATEFEEGWHRLTVKMIKSVNKAGTTDVGFVVFVDGEALASENLAAQAAFTQEETANLALTVVDWNESGKLFRSLAKTTDEVHGVAYDGKGAIDEVGFTDVAPDFAKDPLVANVTFDTTTIAKLYVSNGTETVEFTGTPAAFVYDTEKDYTYWYDAKPGYISLPSTAAKTLDFTSGSDIDIDPASELAATFNGTEYDTLAKAVEAANAESATGTLVLCKDVTEAPVDADVITITANTITLDLNGKSIVAGATDYVSIKAKGGAKLTIVDNGTTTGKVEGGVKAMGGSTTITIEGGAYKEKLSDDYAMEGYKFVAGTGALEGYWVLGLKPIFEGAGTEADPYQIANEKNLVDLADYTAKNDTTGVYFKQTEDITLTEVITPIGADNNKDNANAAGKADDFKAVAFKGIYDGDNKTISNVVLPRADYTGVFGSTFGATIKNLKVACAGFDSNSETANYGGALIAGTTVETTIEGCEVSGSATATKAIAGIVGYACEGTVVKDCINKANLTSTNEKVGGMIGCAQNGDAFGGKTVGEITVDGCTSEGNLSCTTEGKTYVGGLVSYTDSKVVFTGDNVVSGTLTQAGSTTLSSVIALNSGSVELDEGATFTVPAGIKTVTKNAVDGLIFATVDTGVATLVKKADVVPNTQASYKVMATNALTITLENVNDTITIDTTLATVTVNTTATDAYVAKDGNVYTVTAKTTPEITITINPAIVEWTDSMTLPTPAVTVAGELPFVGNWDKEIAEPEAGTTNTYTYTVTVAATDKTLEAKKEATFKVYKAAGPVVPVDDPSKLDDNGKANAQKVVDAFGADLDTYVTAMGYTDGKIPAEKLNKTTEALIEAAKEYNLKIMADPVTVTAGATDDGAFTFALTDADKANPIAAATAAQKLMVYTSDLANEFARDAEAKAVTAQVADDLIKVSFTKKGLDGEDAAAGFMKVDLTVEK